MKQIHITLHNSTCTKPLLGLPRLLCVVFGFLIYYLVIMCFKSSCFFQRETSTTQLCSRAATPRCGRWLRSIWRWLRSILPARCPSYELTSSNCGTTRTSVYQHRCCPFSFKETRFTSITRAVQYLVNVVSDVSV